MLGFLSFVLVGLLGVGCFCKPINDYAHQNPEITYSQKAVAQPNGDGIRVRSNVNPPAIALGVKFSSIRLDVLSTVASGNVGVDVVFEFNDVGTSSILNGFLGHTYSSLTPVVGFSTSVIYWPSINYCSRYISNFSYNGDSYFVYIPASSSYYGFFTFVSVCEVILVNSTQYLNHSIPENDPYWVGYYDGQSSASGGGGVDSSDYSSIYNEGYQNGYSSGYSAGNSEGYGSGYSEGNSEGYSNGYGVGYDEGYDEGGDIGYSSGYQEGFSDGYSSGYDVGYSAGNSDGYGSGYSAGNSEGFSNGYDSGYSEGFDDGLAYSTYVDNGVYLQWDINSSSGRVYSVKVYDLTDDGTISVDTLIYEYSLSYYSPNVYFNRPADKVYRWTITPDVAIPFGVTYRDSANDANVLITPELLYDGVCYLPYWEGSITLIVNPEATYLPVDDYSSYAFELDSDRDVLRYVRVGYGYSLGYQEGYSDGDSHGYSSGYQEGYEEGNSLGYDSGYGTGRVVGYNEGMASVSSGGQVINNLFGAVFGVPIEILNSLSGLTIWSIPLISVIMTIVFLGVVIWVVRKFV